MSFVTGMPHTETGVTVNFPTNDYYQFEACPEYRRVSCDGVKEMDFVWHDNAGRTVWLVELKGFHNPDNQRHVSTDLRDSTVFNQKLRELETKALHTLVMLTTQRTVLHQCGGIPVKKQKIKLIFILELMPQQEVYLTFIKDTLADTMKPLLRLFAVDSLMVVNQEIGRAAGLSWIGATSS